MPETPVFGLPTPAENELATVPTHMQALAQQIEAMMLRITPLGVAFPYYGELDDVPQDWLPFHGQAVSRTTYSKLFAIFGTLHGSGNGSTTFNLPDMRGRVPVGSDQGAGRVTTLNQPGQAGGAQSVTLAAGQIPSHTHSVPAHTHGAGALVTDSRLGVHSHGVGVWANIHVPSSGPQVALSRPFGQSGSPFSTEGNPNLAHSHGVIGSTASGGGGNTGSTGSGQGHNNMQPYSVCIWIGWSGNVTLE